MPFGIRKIPIKREGRVLHQGIDPEMVGFDRVAPAGDMAERRVELGEVAHLDHDMEFRQMRWTQAQLAAHRAPALDQALVPEMAQIGGQAFGKIEIADARFEVAPDVINVHRTGVGTAVDMRVASFRANATARLGILYSAVHRSGRANMGRRYANILETIGHTPVVKIGKLAPEGVNLFVKIEAFNPLGSVKDRKSVV